MLQVRVGNETKELGSDKLTLDETNEIVDKSRNKQLSKLFISGFIILYRLN